MSSSNTLDPKRRCCNLFDAEAYNGVVISLAVIIIILTLIVVIINTAMAPSRDSVFRVAGIATAAQVVGGPGEAGAVYSYQLIFDWNSASILYMVQKLENTTTTPTGLYIAGPMLPFANTGPLTGALCGAPTVACDTTSLPGVVMGQVEGTIYNGIVMTVIDVRPVIEAYRQMPELYYIYILTNGVPTLPGAARGPLFMFSGFP